MEESEEDVKVVAVEKIKENTPGYGMEQIVELARDKDACGEHESNPEKDLKFLYDRQDFIQKRKNTCSNDILPFLVQVEDLMQRKQTVTVKKI